MNTCPNWVAANYLAQAVVNGFCIPYTVPHVYSFATKLKSVNGLEDVVQLKLAKEVAEGRVSGPHPSPLLLSLHSSPLFMLTKKAPGKCRITHHLSYLSGSSVNDAINPELVLLSIFL